MKHLLGGFFVVVFIVGMITCAKLPDESLFQPVNFKPTITTPLQNGLHVVEGQNITLSLGVKGTGPFTFTWYKDIDSIYASDQDSFAIKNAQLSQTGAYIVIVTNDYGRDTSEGSLTVDTLFYSIAVSSVGKGTVSPKGINGTIKVRPQTETVFTYTPDIGSRVDSVIVNGANLPSSTTSTQYTFGGITANSSLRVVFAGIACTLSITPPVNGTIKPGLSPKTEFPFGDTITLTAVPDNGFYFGGWGGDAFGTSATLHLTMNSNTAISATFAASAKLSLSVSSLNGTVTLDPPGGAYDSGSTVKLTAKPDSGYAFSSWKDSASGTKDTVTVTMNSKKIVTAVFSPISYILSLFTSAGGSITAPTSLMTSVLYGTATTITAAAQSGYTFSRWEVDSGTAAIADSTMQSTSVTLTKGNAKIQAVFTQTVTNDSVVYDADGNVYATVTIGAQTWMAENLKTTKYIDGTSITLVTDSIAWRNLLSPGYCWYNNDSVTNGRIYGALYNWFAIDTKKLAPTGWHVPSKAEWLALCTYLGGWSVAGGKLKDTTYWTAPNTEATNISGFTALPGGSRDSSYGEFIGLGKYGNWWSSDATCHIMKYNDSTVTNMNLPKQYGYSIRCVRD